MQPMYMICILAAALVSLVTSVPMKPTISPFLMAVTGNDTGVCRRDDRCNCTMSGDWPVYDDILELRGVREGSNDLEIAIEGSDTYVVVQTMYNVSERITALDETLDEQPIGYTLQELMALQKATDSLTAFVEKIGKSQDVANQIAALRSTLDKLKSVYEEMWGRNPYTDNAEMKDELEDLQKRYKDCQGNRQWTAFDGDTLPVGYRYDDWCDSYELESIGAEVTHRYDAAYGAWFKDPVPISEANRTQIFSRTHASGSAQYLYRYDNYTDFLTNSNSGMFVGTDVMDGVGYVLYNQALYWEYNGYISRRSLEKDTYLKKAITRQVRDYMGSPTKTYVDLKVDEYGLWAILSTDANQDKLVIHKVDPYDLSFKETFVTTRYKASVCAVFMACGTLYTIDVCTNPVLKGHPLKQYMYDTRTRQDHYRSLNVFAKFGHIYSLNYNPRERTIFGWDYYHLVTYPLTWVKRQKP